MRFSKRVKLFPGFHLTFSSSGISSTLGMRGASINFSKRGARLNVSFPGIDLAAYRPGVSPGNDQLVSSMPLKGEIRSADTSELTSASLAELKETLLEVHQDRIELMSELETAKRQIVFYKRLQILSCILLVGFFIKAFKQKAEDANAYAEDLEQQLHTAFVDIDILFDKSFEDKYHVLASAYERLLTSHKIWDVTSSVYNDRKATRSAASTSITRSLVKFSHNHVDLIRSDYPAFHLENKNGGDLYIYPAFVIMINNRRQFALIDIKDFELEFIPVKFLEEERIPADAETIDYTWAKVNKNGQPDKRFKDNYRIPIVRYGDINISSDSGLKESYSFSNVEYARQFSQAFIDYKRMI